mmetsp:Transcript_14494/g.41276  ORF Transcript_14494/g.41276 Transcript_14494/m.41276 type:complete len:268 (+) Transcript_14494:2926-3729(+)
MKCRGKQLKDGPARRCQFFHDKFIWGSQDYCLHASVDCRLEIQNSFPLHPPQVNPLHRADVRLQSPQSGSGERTDGLDTAAGCHCIDVNPRDPLDRNNAPPHELLLDVWVDCFLASHHRDPLRREQAHDIGKQAQLKVHGRLPRSQRSVHCFNAHPRVLRQVLADRVSLHIDVEGGVENGNGRALYWQEPLRLARYGNVHDNAGRSVRLLCAGPGHGHQTYVWLLERIRWYREHKGFCQGPANVVDLHLGRAKLRLWRDNCSSQRDE